MKAEQFILTLEPMPHGPPATVRLRRALKALRRSFGLRCTEIRPATTPSGDAGERSGRGMTEDTASKPTRQNRRRGLPSTTNGDAAGRQATDSDHQPTTKE